jgi:hypothetical protein
MAADFFIDSKLGVVFSKGTGVFTVADALGHMDRLSRHPDFRPEYNQLLDFREFSDVELTGEQVRALSRRTLFRTPSRRAFVVSSNLQFGLSRMYGTFREAAGDETIMIFREMKDALAWLSLSAEPDPKCFRLLNQIGAET